MPYTALCDAEVSGVQNHILEVVAMRLQNALSDAYDIFLCVMDVPDIFNNQVRYFQADRERRHHKVEKVPWIEPSRPIVEV